MAYEKFEQNGVNYTLLLGNHTFSSYPLIENAGGLDSLDVLVIEKTLGGKMEMERKYQYFELFEKIPEKNPDIKVYEIDFPLSSLGHLSLVGEATMYVLLTLYGLSAFKKTEPTRRDVLKKIGKAGVGLVGASFFAPLINAHYNGKDIEIISEINTIRTSLLPLPLIGFRDAAVAKIVEEYIVPQERVDSEELNVGILFGAVHSGVEEKIKYKTLRDVTIGAYRLFDYPGIIRDRLNRVRRITYIGRERKFSKRYQSQDITLDLF